MELRRLVLGSVIADILVDIMLMIVKQYEKMWLSLSSHCSRFFELRLPELSCCRVHPHTLPQLFFGGVRGGCAGEYSVVRSHCGAAAPHALRPAVLTAR